jgi:sodium pump decarboxylase gamma subunit
MDIELLKAGFLLLIIGMGFVFFFFVILIFTMDLVKKVLDFIAKYYPEENDEAKSVKNRKDLKINDEVALAICCAFHKRGELC